MMFLAKVFITLKPTINDPQGLTIQAGLHDLGSDTVRSVRMGKYMEVRLDEATEAAAAQAVEGMCQKLLANPVIEEYRFELQALDQE